MKHYYVYKLTSLSGKSYIGITTKDFNIRLRSHKNTKRNTKISLAIQKYGFDTFTKEIIATTSDLDALFLLEIHFIKLYNSYNKGYNGHPGGKAHVIWTDESKEKVSRANKGHKHTPEAILKMKQPRTPASESRKKAQSDAMKKRHKNPTLKMLAGNTKRAITLIKKEPTIAMIEGYKKLRKK